MKKNLYLAIAAGSTMLLSANYAEAQDVTYYESVEAVETVVTECKDNYSTSWRDNWFIQLGAGIQIPYVDNYLNKGDAKHHITPVYNAGFGHWFSPYLGFRLSGNYGRLHLNWGNYDKAHMANANFDIMWDMFNSIAGPNPSRVFSIIPYAGIGGTYTWGFKEGNISTDHGRDLKTREWALPVNAGIQMRFRLSQYVDFFAEGRVQFYGDNFNNVASGGSIEGNVSVIGGFTFNIGGTQYQKYNPCDYLAYVNSLNNQVNDLRGQLAATAAALASAEAQLPCPEVVAQEEVIVQAPMLSAVRFKLNSAVVTDEEMVNVYNVAEWMKANPEVSVTIQGYADKDTGTAAYNMELSQRRGQAVADILTKKYGISPSRLTIQANGSDTQPYDVNNWNRIVIFTQP